MTPAETADILRQFNEWRRGDYEPSEPPEPPDPCEIGEALDAAVEMIERAESDLATAEQDSRQKQARIERLESALRDVAQTLAWMQHGECRGFSDGLLTTNEALEKARDALEESK